MTGESASFFFLYDSNGLSVLAWGTDSGQWERMGLRGKGRWRGEEGGRLGEGGRERDCSPLTQAAHCNGQRKLCEEADFEEKPRTCLECVCVSFPTGTSQLPWTGSRLPTCSAPGSEVTACPSDCLRVSSEVVSSSLTLT